MTCFTTFVFNRQRDLVAEHDVVPEPLQVGSMDGHMGGLLIVQAGAGAGIYVPEELTVAHAFNQARAAPKLSFSGSRKDGHPLAKAV